MHAFTQTSLLVWDGAPGTGNDGNDLDPDAPVLSHTDADDDDDNDEHVDLS